MTAIPDRIRMIPLTVINAARPWRLMNAARAWRFINAARTWRFSACAALFAISSAVASTAAAQPPAGTTTLVYEFSRSGLKLAEMTDTLKVEGPRYELTSNATGVGVVALLARGQSIRRESRGAIGPTGLVPQSFTEQRGDNYKLTAEFDWPAHEVVMTNAQGERSRDPIPANAQDRLSFPYQIAFAHGTPPPEFSVAVADGRHVTRYAFRLVGTETVSTGLGELKALHYTKVLEGDDTAFDIWLGVEQQLLPIRVTYADKGGARFEQYLRAINPARS
jgi:hypothetical protein